MSVVKDSNIPPKKLVVHINILKQLLNFPAIQLVEACTESYGEAALKNEYLNECSKNMLLDE